MIYLSFFTLLILCGRPGFALYVSIIKLCRPNGLEIPSRDTARARNARSKWPSSLDKIFLDTHHTMALANSYSTFNENISTLTALIATIPESVPLATKDDRIHQIFTSIPPPDNDAEVWEVFNRRFDNLFGEDTRDDANSLPNIKRGEYGMDLVLKYINSVKDSSTMLYEPASVKFGRIITELKRLKYVT